MTRPSEGTYDPATLSLLRSVLDSAWDELDPEQRALTSKSAVAVRILRLAQRGERDPVKLRAAALTGLVSEDRCSGEEHRGSRPRGDDDEQVDGSCGFS